MFRAIVLSLVAVAALALMVSVAVLTISGPEVEATHACCVDAVSIDMEEEADPGNSSSSLGSREACATINENNVLDADEDVVDGVWIDATVAGVPPVDSTDSTGGITAYQFTLNYSAAHLTVQSHISNDPAVNILARDGSDIYNVSEPVPDDNANDRWIAAAVDFGQVPADGEGVLVRITLVTEASAATGIYPLTLSDIFIQDAANNTYTVNAVNHAAVSVNQLCPAQTARPTPSPSPEPTPSPTPTPILPTPSPTPTPVPTPTPTPPLANTASGGGQIEGELGEMIILEGLSPGGRANFGFEVQQALGQTMVLGGMSYVDHALQKHVGSVIIDTLTITGNRATFTGTATVDGVSGVGFLVDVTDLGEPGDADTFRIVLSDGYTAFGVVTHGNIEVNQAVVDPA